MCREYVYPWGHKHSLTGGTRTLYTMGALVVNHNRGAQQAPLCGREREKGAVGRDGGREGGSASISLLTIDSRKLRGHGLCKDKLGLMVYPPTPTCKSSR